MYDKIHFCLAWMFLTIITLCIFRELMKSLHFQKKSSLFTCWIFTSLGLTPPLTRFLLVFFTWWTIHTYKVIWLPPYSFIITKNSTCWHIYSKIFVLFALSVHWILVCALEMFLYARLKQNIWFWSKILLFTVNKKSPCQSSAFTIF